MLGSFFCDFVHALASNSCLVCWDVAQMCYERDAFDFNLNVSTCVLVVLDAWIACSPDNISLNMGICHVGWPSSHSKAEKIGNSFVWKTDLLTPSFQIRAFFRAFFRVAAFSSETQKTTAFSVSVISISADPSLKMVVHGSNVWLLGLCVDLKTRSLFLGMNLPFVYFAFNISAWKLYSANPLNWS